MSHWVWYWVSKSPAAARVSNIVPEFACVCFCVLQFRIPKKYLRDCGWILTKLFLFDKTYTSYRQGHLRSSRQNDMVSPPSTSFHPPLHGSRTVIPPHLSHLLFHLPFTILSALVSPLSFTRLQEGGERGGVGLLALTEVEGEISLLLDEEASTLFPLEQLAVCPLKWCAIKLCGRKFDFHETGCVCAMSKVRSLKVSYIIGVSGYVCS